MNMDYLKKALIRGIPSGLVLALALVLVRMLVSGGTFGGHLSSLYGILLLICFPIAWVLFFYDREKKSGK